MQISIEQSAATADRIIAIHSELKRLDETTGEDGMRGQQLEGEMEQLGRLRWLNQASNRPRSSQEACRE